MNARCLLYADVCQPLAEVFHATDNANIRCRTGRSQAKARAFHFYFIPIQLTQMRLCQNAAFWCSLKGASEWSRCKALRLRVKGVYWRTRPNPNADSNAADWPF